MPFLKVTDTMKTLLSTDDWILFGGGPAGREASELLLDFWDKYRLQHPSHEVFQHGRERLACTIPITLHGDGGRTQKKQALETVSMQPCLGIDSRASGKSLRCRCATSTESGHDLGSPLLNTKHSSFLTHFLIFAYPGKKHQDFPKLLEKLMHAVCDDVAVGCREGVLSASGARFYIGCLGLKVDMEWAVKCASLTSSYQNVGHVNEKGCCHECRAGEPQIPFEDVSATAAWTRTRFQTTPWRGLPFWRNVPWDRTKPSLFFRRDSFHVFRMGIARNFAGSCIYMLCLMNCPLASFWYTFPVVHVLP